MPKRKLIPYNPILKELARNLRNNSTLSEILLWKKLKGKQICVYDFHHQKPLDNYTPLKIRPGRDFLPLSRGELLLTMLFLILISTNFICYSNYIY
ncbi:DUF559 domain-containing protein [candidate division KSB1 bacterium]|nr:DUF559 domain-containing protein [candidate division KSB1 bacterium]